MADGNSTGDYPATSTNTTDPAAPASAPVRTTASPAIYPAGSPVPVASPAPSPVGTAAPVATPAASPDTAAPETPAVNTASTLEESQARGEPLVIRPFPGR